MLCTCTVIAIDHGNSCYDRGQSQGQYAGMWCVDKLVHTYEIQENAICERSPIPNVDSECAPGRHLAQPREIAICTILP